jgi:16S rRNA (adenine1518-N6/adenine1519-N6)-dimethyltransferase
MNSSDEILDVVDEQDRVIDQATRLKIHSKKLRHRAVHVFLFNPQGELFLQKRSASKDTFPLCYDSSASGHVDHGETDDICAVRELKEELGLDLSREVFQRCFSVTACEETGEEFVTVYSIRGNYTPLINPAEIESGAFWPVSKVFRLLAEHPQQCALSFIRVFREFQQRNLLP